MIQEKVMFEGEYNDVCKDIQDYIMDNNFIQRALQFKMVKENGSMKEKSPIKKKEITEQIWFLPNQQDTLFWCYYIIVNGISAYEMLHNKNFLVAKQMKIELVIMIRKHKDTLKTYKFDTITNIESNLANDSCINIKTFLALCCIANINVVYISRKTYFRSLMNDTNVVYVVNEKYKGSKYEYCLAADGQIDEIYNTLYKVDKIDKPIKAFSSYHVEELVNMCEKLAIEYKNNSTGKTKPKKDLYESIVQYF